VWLGRLSEAASIAVPLLHDHRLTSIQKSICEFVLGRVAREQSGQDIALEHFQRSASAAAAGKDLKRYCHAQMWAMLTMGERNGPDATRLLLADVRKSVVNLGDPRTTATLHMFVAAMEGQRGLLRNAQRHAEVALELVADAPNCWIEAFAQNILAAVALARSDYKLGLVHAMRATELASRSGCANIYRGALGNLGNVLYALGKYDEAIDHFQRATSALPGGPDNNNWSRDSIARIRLSQRRLGDCAQLLDEIESSFTDETARRAHANRCAALTRCVLLAREGRLKDAIKRVDDVLEVAKLVDDRLLRLKCLLTKAELLNGVGAEDAFRVTLDKVATTFDSESPEVYAQYEAVLACASARESDQNEAIQHFARAKRICRAIESVHAEFELDAAVGSAIVSQSTPKVDVITASTATAATVLDSLGCVFRYASRPEVVGRELLAILYATGCIVSAELKLKDPNGEKTVASVGLPDGCQSQRHTIALGVAGHREFSLVLHAKDNFQSVAVLSSVAMLVDAVRRLQRAVMEEEERAKLWPTDDAPNPPHVAPILGHMRDLFNYAQRVARTTVNVLITGESGTGKEIVARAIHDFSDRAQKPFIPVNCSAVPRELLESQLFGHRRGAFTGADRDHTGFIRAARDGTLFLDEIADLSLDLQPKLLRFLESGEISPLGETAPQTVNVRILAATNTKLEDAVRQGKFREDLFYRLNVVRLSIHPLRERRDEIPGLVNHFVARSAQEFKKGQLTLAEETMERLLLYRWPGNVRQLQNEIRRIVALAEPNSTVTPDAISEDILRAMPIFRQIPNGSEIAVSLHDKLPATIARIESEMIKVALRQHHGKVDAAAKALGISRKGLYLKRQRLGL